MNHHTLLSIQQLLQNKKLEEALHSLEAYVNEQFTQHDNKSLLKRSQMRMLRHRFIDYKLQVLQKTGKEELRQCRQSIVREASNFVEELSQSSSVQTPH